MPLQNVFEIDVDIKSKTAIRTPTVTQNDTVIFIFRIFDEGRIYNIEDGSTFTMTSTRPDKQAVITVGEVTGPNTIRFKLGTTELAVRGKVEAVIQVYDADGRVSTIPFKYEVLSDPSGDYIPSEDEETLIQKVLGEGPKILADAQQATTEANEAAEAANTATDNANQIASELDQAITETRQATQDALDITEIATLAEQVRVEAESERQQNEAARVQAETSRQEAEDVRQQQEAQRQSATQTAISNAEQATEGAQAVADNTRYIEPYNSETEYKKNNVVRYGKNSYIALQDTQGNTPNASGDTAYWGLLAVGGVDGTGSVSSVNGIGPDENGNVEIDIPDPADFATKQELQTLDNIMSEAAQQLQEEITGVGESLTTHITEFNDYIGNTKGFRLTDGVLEFFDGTEWHQVKGGGGGGGYPLGNVEGLSIRAGDEEVTIRWKDPEDIVITDNHGLEVTLAKWKGTKLVRKTGTWPNSEIDGTLVIDSTQRNAYESSGYVDTDLTNDTTYYYALFPYSEEGVVTIDPANRVSAKPQEYDDSSGSPGSHTLIAGTMDAGYFGTVPAREFITGADLSTLVGFSTGTLQNTNTNWLKFSHEGKILFAAMKPIRHSVRWDWLNNADIVYGGKIVTIRGLNYRVRLFRGALTDPVDYYGSFDGGSSRSEWNKLMLPINILAPSNFLNQSFAVGVESWGIGFTNDDLGIGNYTGSITLCQETPTSGQTTRITRSSGGTIVQPELIGTQAVSNTSSAIGWRPVLELV